MSDRDPHERVRWVYSSRSLEEVRDRYDAWADDYDADLTETYDYALPRLTVDEFQRFVDPAAHVLDAGAGTGLVGVELAARGFTSLVGIDISPGMLAHAEATGVYQSLHEMTLGEPLDFPDDAFDAVISVGTFTDGHAPPSGFHELVRVTRPEGLLVVAIRDDIIDSHGFRAVFDALAPHMRLRYVSDLVVAMPKTEPDVTVQIWCFEVA